MAYYTTKDLTLAKFASVSLRTLDKSGFAGFIWQLNISLFRHLKQNLPESI